MREWTEQDDHAYDEQCRNPVGWLGDAFGESYWQAQQDIINSVRDNPRTAVKSCHSGGKTRVATGIVVWFLNTFPDSIIITTAPTWRQVDKLLWGEIRSLYPKQKFPLAGKPMQTPILKVSDLWYAFGLSTDDPDRFQGFHAPYILVVGDEASGIDDAIFEAIRGVMASGNVRMLLLGNPTRPQGEFYEAFNGKRALYHQITINAFYTPNLEPLRGAFEAAQTKQEKLDILRAAPVKVPYLIAASWVADILEEFGEDSSFWQSRVLGEFPSETPDQLIPLHWIEAAEYRWERLKAAEKWWQGGKTEHPIEMGCDIARYGDSESVFCSRAGDIEAPTHLPGKLDTMSTAGAVIAHAKERGARVVRIDADGIGSGTYDRCREERLEGVVPFHGGQSASNTERFSNARSEGYWALRQRYEQGTIATPPDKKKAGQLSSLRYRHTPKGQIQIESKDEMRKRGVASPDRADAEMMAFAGIQKMLEPDILI